MDGAAHWKRISELWHCYYLICRKAILLKAVESLKREKMKQGDIPQRKQLL